MSKLYIFGIGGTGSRVLKSLTMLLASGVKIKADEIVPVIIDPDLAAANLTQTVALMRNYVNIRNSLNFNTASKNKFFGTKLNLDIVPNVVMTLQDTQDKKFREYIGLDSMRTDGRENANYALASMLFSQKNLDSNMEVGFKGNPNIGSVVLNQYQDSPVFQNIAASFNQGDRIFVISSIFGGTGASGFPLLIKNLRAVSTHLSGSGYVKNAPIGAITVLPYFDLAPDTNPDEEQRSEIDSSTFISKTKAALTYYDRNVTETNVLYYIADTVSKQYNNVEGGTEQKNEAHFVELAAALSIIDFMAMPDDSVSTQNGQPDNTIYKEYGIIAVP